MSRREERRGHSIALAVTKYIFRRQERRGLRGVHYGIIPVVAESMSLKLWIRNENFLHLNVYDVYDNMLRQP
jgi:hypothetical protein